MNKVIETYSRIWPFIRALPLLAALPLAVELTQHVAEIELGLYASGGVLPPEARQVRLAFGVVKILGLLVTIVVALRWFAFQGNARRAFRPTWILAKGIVAYVLFDAVGEILQDGLDRLFQTVYAPSHAGEVATHVASELVWIFLSGLWLPWNVALLVEDRTMTFRRSVRTTLPRIALVFGYLCAGIVPLMALHQALGFLALTRAPAIVWSLNIVDAGVVVLLAIAIGSSFFTVHRWAADRAGAAT